MTRRRLAGPLLVAAAVAAGLFVISGGPGSGTPAASTAPAASSFAAGATASSGSPTPSVAVVVPTERPSQSPIERPSASPSSSPSPSPGAPTVSPALAKRLQKALDRFAAANRLPGSSVTITWADGRTWTGTSGYADVTARRPVTPDTVFGIASMSKTFTSALILGLVDEGKLGLDTKVATLLPKVRLGSPGTPIPAGVTVRMLLDHTSGLADYFFGKGIDKALMANRGATWTAAQALAYVGKPLGKPGRTWHYSNTNYLLLGLVAERVGGAPFARLVRQRLLDPVGLERAYIQVAEKPTGPLALGYYYNQPGLGARPIGLADTRRTVVPFTSVVTAAGSAGDVAATSADLAAWARALYGGKVLKPATLALAVGDARQTAAYRPYVPYGLGVQVTRIDGHRAFGHSGRFIGVRGELRYLPGPGLAIAVLTNQNGADLRPLTARLVALALPKPATNP
jgi:D-alanyl-D-alanine carboxypeptidase